MVPDHIVKEILKNSQPYPEPRQPTMHLALQLLNTCEATNILEAGTTRTQDEGLATIVFANFLLYGYQGSNDGRVPAQPSPRGKLWTVDIDNTAIRNVEAALARLPIDIHCVVSDSVEFIRNFNEKIDLFYLDSLQDHVRDRETMKLVRAGGREHQLEEAKAAFECGAVHEKTVFLLDDQRVRNFELFNGNDDNGKGILSVPFLKTKGWSIINESGAQAVMINKEAWDQRLVENMIHYVEGNLINQRPFEW